VLGVRPDADTEELRRAYRRALRQTHPDTGGVAVRFHAVQAAWESVGTPDDRARYDRGSAGGGSGTGGSAASGTGESRGTWARSAPVNQRGTRPAPRVYGIAGGWQRDDYLRLLAEWSPAAAGDPYNPVVVRSAPAAVRRVLARALAEEDDAQSLSTVGIGFTIWHDVAVGRAPEDSDAMIDHVVLGASGLFAVSSEDWGAPVRTRRVELIGAGLGPDEQPMHVLSHRARYLGRVCRVKFTALVIVVPDDASDSSAMMIGSLRGTPTLLVQRSRLPDIMRTGLGTAPFRGGAEVFDVRTRLSAGVRFA